DKIDNLTLALGYTPLNNQPDSKYNSTIEQSYKNTDVQEAEPQKPVIIENTQQSSRTLKDRFEKGLKAFFKS
ncbi:hypothetical protein ABTB97_21145, partial [Acinetobacter baumannii]